MEAIHSSESSVNFKPHAWCHNLEDNTPYVPLVSLLGYSGILILSVHNSCVVQLSWFSLTLYGSEICAYFANYLWERNLRIPRKLFMGAKFAHTSQTLYGSEICAYLAKYLWERNLRVPRKLFMGAKFAHTSLIIYGSEIFAYLAKSLWERNLR
jgi:hypothetical protein